MFMDKDKDMDKKDPDFKEYVDEKVSKLEELIKNQTDTIESMKRKMDVKIEETSTSGVIESENGENESAQEPEEEQETVEQEPEEEQEETVALEQEPLESPIPKKSQIKIPILLNQGAYGCIFKPELGCDVDESDTGDYVSKLQMKTKELEKEIKIGIELQEIKNYYYYFAPIIKTCNVNIRSIDSKIVRGCKVITNEIGEIDTKSEYASNKIRYVGKYNMNKILQMITTTKKLSTLMNNHLYLLNSIKLMFEKNIIHLDLKTDNIMWDENQQIPIIIDFGLSFNIKELLDKNTTDYSSEDSPYVNIFIGKQYYVFWCVDIFMICQIVNYYNKGNVEPHVLEIILNRMLRDPYFQKIFTNDDINLFKSKYDAFFSAYVGKPWTDLLISLLQEKNYSTWDNHSLCTAIMFTIIDNDMIYSQDMATKEYIKLIRDVIIAMPGERIGIEETQKRIKEIIRNQEAEKEEKETKEEDVVLNIETNVSTKEEKEETKQEDVVINIETNVSTKEEDKIDHPEDKKERI
jgi:serine/threonine protein kinase